MGFHATWDVPPVTHPCGCHSAARGGAAFQGRGWQAGAASSQRTKAPVTGPAERLSSPYTNSVCLRIVSPVGNAGFKTDDEFDDVGFSDEAIQQG